MEERGMYDSIGTGPNMEPIQGKIIPQVEESGNTVNYRVKYVPYQKCPVCDGLGVVANLGPVTVTSWSPYVTCSVCNGAKIIPMCEVKID